MEQRTGRVGVRSSPNKPAIASHLRQWQQQLTHAEQKLNALAAITLTLTADEVASAQAQHAEQRPLRQRLVALHGQIVPQQKRLAQLQVAIQKRHSGADAT